MNKYLSFLTVFAVLCGLFAAACSDSVSEGSLALERIEVTRTPYKTAYVIGDTLQPEGIVVTAYFNDESTIVLDESSVTISPIAPGDTEATQLLTVSYGGKSATFEITVYRRLGAGDDIAAYLAAKPAEEDPAYLFIGIDLGDMTQAANSTAWISLLTALQGAKSIALDLSSCTMTGVTFSAFTNTTLSQGQIVSLVLPNSAETIADGEPDFNRFSALKTVSGAKITKIGKGAFYKLSLLENVNFPLAADIGEKAFYQCASVSAVSLPLALSIGAEAFFQCTSLQTANLPAVNTIGRCAFADTGSQTLVIFMGTAAPALGDAMFNSAPAKTVTVKVPSEASGYAASLPFTVSGSDTTGNWGNAFRGLGWDGTAYLGMAVNDAITLTIEN